MRTALALPFLLVACDSDSPASKDTNVADTVVNETTVGDTSVDDTNVQETTVSDTEVEGGDIDEHSFVIRVPRTRTIPETQPDGGTVDVQRSDIDHVCRVDVDGLAGFIYVRANPISCGVFGGCQYEVSGAWKTLDGGTVVGQPLYEASYEYGGNHHNDTITFPNGEHDITLGHSSFGFGFRSCAPPDCARILDSSAVVIEDGCTTDRTIPSPCALVDENGAYAIPATFEKCNGDPNADPQ